MRFDLYQPRVIGKLKNGRYEAFVSDHSKSIFLGTYDTPEEAREAVFNYRADRFISGVEEYGLNPDDSVVYEDNYVVFENGMIFNSRYRELENLEGLIC